MWHLVPKQAFKSSNIQSEKQGAWTVLYEFSWRIIFLGELVWFIRYPKINTILNWKENKFLWNQLMCNQFCNQSIATNLQPNDHFNIPNRLYWYIWMISILIWTLNWRAGANTASLISRILLLMEFGLTVAHFKEEGFIPCGNFLLEMKAYLHFKVAFKPRKRIQMKGPFKHDRYPNRNWLKLK